MKKSMRMVLAVILLACGYLMGRMEPPLFAPHTAHAIQGPTMGSLSCNLNVRVSCQKMDGQKYAYLHIIGSPAVNLGWGARISKDPYGNPMVTVRLK